MSILQKLRAFHALDGSGRRLVLEVLLVPVLVSTGFRLLGVPRTQAVLRWWAHSGGSKQRPPDPQPVILLALRAQLAAKLHFGIENTCLVRSLALWTLLLRRGLATDLRVGFRKAGGNLEGHAWIEFDGVPVNEKPEIVQTYTVFKDSNAFDAGRIRFR